MKYAEKTTVTVEKSRAQIETTLKRYGADQFMYYTDAGRAALAFRLNGHNIKLMIFLPTRDTIGLRDRHGYSLSETQIEKKLEQALRQRWRALLLYLKAKLEFIENELSTVEDEFLTHLMLPSGETVGERILPQIRNGQMPAMLPIPKILEDGESR